MSSYNVLDARNNLSRLVADAESGVEVTITRRGTPVARIVPIGRRGRTWDDWFDGDERTTDDFLRDRDQGVAEERLAL